MDGWMDRVTYRSSVVYELLVLFFICENHIIAIDIFNDLFRLLS